MSYRLQVNLCICSNTTLECLLTQRLEMYHKITIYTFPKLLLLLIVDIFDLFFRNELWHLPDIYILDFSETLS